MRKWHRWTTVFFGIFMLWMALTGVASHISAMVVRGSIFENEAGERHEGPAQAAATAPAPAGAAAPAQSAPDSGRRIVGFFHHLHSGEAFGPIGTIISLLTGFALIFFAISGMWMYIQMFRQRRRIGRKDMFWK